MWKVVVNENDLEVKPEIDSQFWNVNRAAMRGTELVGRDTERKRSVLLFNPDMPNAIVIQWSEGRVVAGPIVPVTPQMVAALEKAPIRIP